MLPRTFPQANLGKMAIRGDALAFWPLCYVLPQPMYSISLSQVKVREKGCGRFRSREYSVFGPRTVSSYQFFVSRFRGK
jgi:hypothetical protein